MTLVLSTNLQTVHDRDAYGCIAKVGVLEGSNMIACGNPQCQWSRIDTHRRHGPACYDKKGKLVCTDEIYVEPIL